MPDQQTACPSDGGCEARTRGLLLAKAQNTVHEGAPQGTEPAPVEAAAAAAATRHRPAPESLPETDPAVACIVCGGTGAAHGDYHDPSGAWCDACEGTGLDDTAVIAAIVTLRGSNPHPEGVTLDELATDLGIDWDALERHARALDRSAACHTLRVRAAQAIGQQRHARLAVGW